MGKLPKIIDVEVNTIYGEKIEAKIIPLSVKANMDMESMIEEIKETQFKKRENRINRASSNVKMKMDDDKIKDSFVDMKILTELIELGLDTSDERIAKLKKSKGEKILDGKDIPNIIEELSKMTVDLEERNELIHETIAITVYHSLRKADNLREKVFSDINDLKETLDTDDMINILTQVNKNNDVDEETLKNSQSPVL